MMPAHLRFSAAERASVSRLNDELATALRATVNPQTHSLLLGALLTGERLFDAGEASSDQMSAWLADACLALDEYGKNRHLPVVCVACAAEAGRELPSVCVMAACYRHRHAAMVRPGLRLPPNFEAVLPQEVR